MLICLPVRLRMPDMGHIHVVGWGWSPVRAKVDVIVFSGAVSTYAP